jgi:hypothetical protein
MFSEFFCAHAAMCLSARETENAADGIARKDSALERKHVRRMPSGRLRSSAASVLSY